MTLRIFIDANVFMYAAGREHPLKESSIRVLGLVTDYPATFLTSAEVLQEMIHRYRALRWWDAGKHHFFEAAALMEDRIEPMLAEDVIRAAELADRYPLLSARDLAHIAVMLRAGATHIASADSAFDAVSEVARLDPMRVTDWMANIRLQ